MQREPKMRIALPVRTSKGSTHSSLTPNFSRSLGLFFRSCMRGITKKLKNQLKVCSRDNAYDYIHTPSPRLALHIPQ